MKRLYEVERIVAFALGASFLLVGIAGFLPGFVSPISADAPSLAFNDGYGNVLGLFPTNFLHNAIHIVVGLLGLAAATSVGGSLVYNQLFAIAYIGIALMGLLPGANTTFGVMPIFGNNVWFNALTGLIAGYYGFVKPAKAIEASNP
ncbi:DUF4383 domain-containing protein [Microcoleus sp. FACHB-1515]|uniref:DUF4383 domain-containing protein n=1 Tax=Cyanophyceae TaxID=3028117 RepID=UPI001F54F007|nr:DUF4383 domain-containing protein [Microcoleus sp. FACHB-1515]